MAKASLETTHAIQEIIKISKKLNISLKPVGMFDLFAPVEWLQDIKQQGRILSAILYLQEFPEKMTEAETHQLLHLKNVNLYPIVKEHLNKLSY